MTGYGGVVQYFSGGIAIHASCFVDDVMFVHKGSMACHVYFSVVKE